MNLEYVFGLLDQITANAAEVERVLASLLDNTDLDEASAQDMARFDREREPKWFVEPPMNPVSQTTGD